MSENGYYSNRHEDAKNDEGKLTKGEFVSLLKKITKESTDFLNEMIDCRFSESKPFGDFFKLEWHHAGMFKGNMRKVYHINCTQIAWFCQNFEEIKRTLIESKQRTAKFHADRSEFLKKNAEYLIRSEKRTDVVENAEMLGRNGWFEASWKYNCQTYYTGWNFKSPELLASFKEKFKIA